MKVVLDTNVVISGIFWTGSPHKIIKMWSDKCSDEIMLGGIIFGGGVMNNAGPSFSKHATHACFCRLFSIFFDHCP